MFGEDWREAGALYLIECLNELVNGDRFNEPAELLESLINMAPVLGVMVKAEVTYGIGTIQEAPQPGAYKDF
ncbi:hypothetical protein [Leptolyngbya sp. CCY15150]|uniref:hypothetical protein n=1 Tax=Leptolyngbya sp. CCY15150 TaxID=2767772 RepID=UPI001950ED46|nr:hypothetical protein [Leptolyngbya sp. CCY15150]